MVAPDQDHHALLHVRQQHVLLGLVEAVDLVDEQQRLAGRWPRAGRGPRSRISRSSLTPLATALSWRNVLRVSLASSRASVVLPRARRAVEDHRPEAVGRQQPPQQFPFAEEVLLADELVQGPRPHPRRQRLGLLAVRLFALVE